MILLAALAALTFFAGLVAGAVLTLCFARPSRPGRVPESDSIPAPRISIDIEALAGPDAHDAADLLSALARSESTVARRPTHHRATSPTQPTGSTDDRHRKRYPMSNAYDATSVLLVAEVHKLLDAAQGPPTRTVDPDDLVRAGVPRALADEISDASAGVVDREDVSRVLDRFRSRLGEGADMDPISLARDVPRW